MTSRAANELRAVNVQRNFTETAAGSVLWRQGGTLVLCTAAVEIKRPRFYTDDQPGGWVTGEYVMHPASVPGRKDWPGERLDKRATEIGRLIGRSLRAAIDMTKLGPHTITIDCTVLQADGGTRTASICGGMIALHDALRTLPEKMPGAVKNKRPAYGSEDHGDYAIAPAFDAKFYKPAEAIQNPLAAVSVGIIDGQAVLDLDYVLDSRAEVDLNVVRTAAGNYVELQGSAEHGNGFSPAQLAEMLKLANAGIDSLLDVQKAAMA